MIDLDDIGISYVIGKGLHDLERIKRTIAFKEGEEDGASLAATYFGDSNEPFAALHRLGA